MTRAALLCVLTGFLNLPCLAQIVYPGGGENSKLLDIVDSFYVRKSGSTNMTGGLTNEHGFYGPLYGDGSGITGVVKTNDPAYLAGVTGITYSTGNDYATLIANRMMYLTFKTNFSYVPVASVMTNASEWSRYPALQDVDFNDWGISNLISINLSYRSIPRTRNIISTDMGTNGVPINTSEWIYYPSDTVQVVNVMNWMVPPLWTSAWLTASNFGFAIDTNRSITGIRAMVDMRETHSISVQSSADYFACEMKLIKPDGTESDSFVDYTVHPALASFIPIPGTTNVYFPSATDSTNLWGLSVSPQEVNSNSFALAFRFFHTNAAAASSFIKLPVSSVDITVFSGTTVPAKFEAKQDGLVISVGETNTAMLTPTNAVFYVSVDMPERYTYPVFRLPMGGTWTDFELKGSTNNFDSLCYFYISSGTNTVGRGDTNCHVYFSDDYAVDVRKWIKADYGTSIYSQLSDSKAEIDNIYVFPSHDCEVPWEEWMWRTNKNLVWSWVRFDGMDFEKNADGTKQKWNLIRPDSWEIERTTP